MISTHTHTHTFSESSISSEHPLSSLHRRAHTSPTLMPGCGIMILGLLLFFMSRFQLMVHDCIPNHCGEIGIETRLCLSSAWVNSSLPLLPVISLAYFSYPLGHIVKIILKKYGRIPYRLWTEQDIKSQGMKESSGYPVGQPFVLNRNDGRLGLCVTRSGNELDVCDLYPKCSPSPKTCSTGAKIFSVNNCLKL